MSRLPHFRAGPHLRRSGNARALNSLPFILSGLVVRQLRCVHGRQEADDSHAADPICTGEPGGPV